MANHARNDAFIPADCGPFARHWISTDEERKLFELLGGIANPTSIERGWVATVL